MAGRFTLLDRNHRAEKAFVDGVLGDDVVPLTAALAGQDTGSLRQAIDILYEAGSLARKGDAEMIVEAHVRTAAEQVERGVLQDDRRVARPEPGLERVDQLAVVFPDLVRAQVDDRADGLDHLRLRQARSFCVDMIFT